LVGSELQPYQPYQLFEVKITSYSALNLLNLNYLIKFFNFLIIFKDLNSADSELHLCLLKYVRQLARIN